MLRVRVSDSNCTHPVYDCCPTAGTRFSEVPRESQHNFIGQGSALLFSPGGEFDVIAARNVVRTGLGRVPGRGPRAAGLLVASLLLPETGAGETLLGPTQPGRRVTVLSGFLDLMMWCLCNGEGF